MEVISIKENPEYTNRAIKYFQRRWGSETTMMLYEDSIKHTTDTSNPFPQWYLLLNKDEIIGCAGLIPNDFISRMDLYPWLCALYIEEKHRGSAYATMLINKAKTDAKAHGFNHLYLCTDHLGYYEKYDFKYLGTGYHPWGASSRIYTITL